MDTIFRTSKNALDVVRVSREMAKGRIRADAAHASVVMQSGHQTPGSDDEKAQMRSSDTV